MPKIFLYILVAWTVNTDNPRPVAIAVFKTAGECFQAEATFNYMQIGGGTLRAACSAGLEEP